MLGDWTLVKYYGMYECSVESESERDWMIVIMLFEYRGGLKVRYGLHNSFILIFSYKAKAFIFLLCVLCECQSI